MPDALIDMLVNEYKVPPEQAQTFARQILSGKGNSTDPDGLAQKAYGRRAQEEIDNLGHMRYDALAFTKLHAKVQRGLEITDPETKAWYDGVLQAHHDKVRQDAAASQQAVNRGKLADGERAGAAAEMTLGALDNQRQWANNFQPDGFNPTQMVGTSLVPIGRDEMAAYQKYAANSFGEPRDAQVQAMPYDVGQAQVRSLGVPAAPQLQNSYMGRR